MTDTPVVLFVFNRPDMTGQVFAAVRQARPRQLFIVADGPRPDHPDDGPRCAAARAVVEHVDWPCAVRTQFAPANLGIMARVTSGLDWVFAQVEQAIILEDDCVPHPSFFRFCTELLAHYRDEERVLCISGNNFQFGRHVAQFGYHFSHYPLTWGWATWRQAWQAADLTMGQWPDLRDAGWLAGRLETPAARRYWRYIFQRNHESQENWDYAWVFSCWQRDGLSITPCVNLVSNIGFGTDATHTWHAGDRFACMPVQAMPFPLQHPPQIARDASADAVTEETTYSGKHFVQPMFRAIREHVGSRTASGGGATGQGDERTARPDR